MDLFGAEAVIDEDDEEAGGFPDLEDQVFSSAEGLPQSPRTMGFCLGHEALEKALLGLFNEKRLPHAVIFAGLEGIGKATLGYRFSRFLLAQSGDEAGGGLFGEPLPAENFYVSEESPVFRQVASGAHPDFLSVERKFDELKGRKAATLEVDEIRKITPFLRLSSSNGGWRAVLVDDADTMNRSAQNSILKILEEPPPKTIIILIAHRVGALIPTIRSRARVYHMNPLAFGDFESLLRRLGQGTLSATEMQALHELSSGAPGRALALLEEGGLDNLGRLLELLSAWPQTPWAAVHAFAEELARPGADKAFDNFCINMLWAVQSLVSAKAREAALPTPLQQAPAFLQIMQGKTLPALTGTYEALEEHLDKVRTGNLEKREAVLRCFALWAKT